MNPSLVDNNLAVTGRSDDDGWIADPVLQIIKYYETRMYLREMWSIFARYGEDSTDKVSPPVAEWHGFWVHPGPDRSRSR